MVLLAPKELPAAALEDGMAPLALPLVAFFDAPECPRENWVLSSQSAGRLLRTTRTASQVGTSWGEPLLDAEDRKHSHSFDLSLSLEGKALCGNNGCCNDQGAKARTSPFSGQTGGASTGLPFLQTPACEFQGADLSFPEGSIAYFLHSTCPTGWLPAGDGGQFLVGVPPGFSIGGALGARGKDEAPEHDHRLAGSLDPSECRYVLAAGCSNKSVARSGKVDFDGVSGTRSLNLPSFTLLACERSSAPPVGTPPPPPAGLLTYFRAASCPAGWSEATAFERRLLVALPEGGRAGVTFGGAPLEDLEDRRHGHSLTGKYLTCSQSIIGVAGCCAGGYACNGTYDYNGEAIENSTGLAYLQLLLCRKD